MHAMASKGIHAMVTNHWNNTLWVFYREGAFHEPQITKVEPGQNALVMTAPTDYTDQAEGTILIGTCSPKEKKQRMTWTSFDKNDLQITLKYSRESRLIIITSR